MQNYHIPKKMFEYFLNDLKKKYIISEPLSRIKQIDYLSETRPLIRITVIHK